jgi:muramoyltetrapeptide carboxypeptidase
LAVNPLLPPRLRRGDCIGIVAPAGPVADLSLIERGVRYLERLGYAVAVGKHAARTHGYLAGTDRQRLEDLHAMFRDPRVRMIMALRGGYGSSRLLSAIDYRMIARNPKILAGFSDLTALQLALWKKCRLVTFHGPMLASDFSGRIDPFTEEQFWRLITSPSVPERIHRDSKARAGIATGERATGRLLGGNLSLIVSLLGTPFQPSFNGGILFFEEVGEEPYRIDRMLTHLQNAGILKRLHGIASGQFRDCGPDDPHRPSLTLRRILVETAERTGVPFLSGLPFGHIRRKVTIPIGVRAGLDPERGTLDLLEAAVR